MQKISTGVSGLDLLTGGGYPAGRSTLIFGGPGAGKTLLAMQGLARSASQGEGGVFVSFEEDPNDIVRNFGAFDWGLPDHVAAGRITAVDARIGPTTSVSGSFEIEGLLSILSARLKATGATRLVLDGIDILLSLEPSPRDAIRQMLTIERFVRDHALTALITLKSDDIGAGMAIAPYIGDCVINLDRRMEGDVSVATLDLVKYRGSPTPGIRMPMAIDDAGIALLFEGNHIVEHKVFKERLSSGVARLDTMLGGGYYRGTTVLVSGAPGTAKTTLSAAVVAAACNRGERALFVSFDESSAQIVRNAQSVNVDLAPHLASGALHMVSLRAALAPAQLHVHNLCRLIDTHLPTVLVIDPVSALIKSGGKAMVDSVIQLLVDFIKVRGITGILTALVDSENPEHEVTLTHVSTIADTWLHLTFVAQGGERNRALTVVKSRGSGHSNQVRELVLRDSGPTLADVYTDGGVVLMGTARLEREAEVAAARARKAFDIHARRTSEAAAIEEARARIAALEAEVSARTEAVSLLDDLEATAVARDDDRLDAVLRSRGADAQRLPSRSAAQQQEQPVPETAAPETS